MLGAKDEMNPTPKIRPEPSRNWTTDPDVPNVAWLGLNSVAILEDLGVHYAVLTLVNQQPTAVIDVSSLVYACAIAESQMEIYD